MRGEGKSDFLLEVVGELAAQPARRHTEEHPEGGQRDRNPFGLRRCITTKDPARGEEERDDRVPSAVPCTHAPRTRVLILSGYPEQQFALGLIRAGASGYLSKRCEPAEILHAIREVASGKLYITPVVAELLVQELAVPEPEHDGLTDREFQVLLHLARGQPSSQIAAALSLSRKTVSTYRTRLLAKLGLHTSDH